MKCNFLLQRISKNNFPDNEMLKHTPCCFCRESGESLTFSMVNMSSLESVVTFSNLNLIQHRECVRSDVSVTVQYSRSSKRSRKVCAMLRFNKSFSLLWFELKLISYSAFLTLDLLAPCNSNIGVLESSRAFMLKRSQAHY